MRSKVATGISVLVLVAACSGAGAPAGTWLYGPTASPPVEGTAPSPTGMGGSAPPAASPGEGSGEVTVSTDTGSDLLFVPETVSVTGGGTVQVSFENVSIVPHNLTFEDPIDAATAPVVDPGASETISFEAPAPGDYPFVCTLHPGMDGVLTIEGP